jgi:hypothetical protein
MGLFSALFGAATKQPPVLVTIPFDSNWFDSWESLRIKQEQNRSPIEVSVSFNDELLEQIWDSITNHTSTNRILYDEEQQPINNVGESYRQKQIEDFCDGIGGEELGWLAGFLMPELANPHDKTAVAIYAIRPTAQAVDSGNPFKLVHAGYMDKESAKKVHKKILNLMGKDQFIPLLVRVQGGTQDKPNFGVFAYAKTKAIKFP